MTVVLVNNVNKVLSFFSILCFLHWLWRCVSFSLHVPLTSDSLTVFGLSRGWIVKPAELYRAGFVHSKLTAICIHSVVCTRNPQF